MGIVKLDETADEKPKAPRRRRPIRVSLPSPLAPSRLLLVVALAIGAAEAPETWLRGLLLAGALIVSYLAGHRDGRRDHAIDLVRDRGNPRPAGRTTSGEAGS